MSSPTTDVYKQDIQWLSGCSVQEAGCLRGIDLHWRLGFTWGPLALDMLKGQGSWHEAGVGCLRTMATMMGPLAQDIKGTSFSVSPSSSASLFLSQLPACWMIPPILRSDVPYASFLWEILHRHTRTVFTSSRHLLIQLSWHYDRSVNHHTKWPWLHH